MSTIYGVLVENNLGAVLAIQLLSLLNCAVSLAIAWAVRRSRSTLGVAQ